MLLGSLFTLVAIFYASVGFGGGSSYLALLILWGLPYTVIPVMALICNIVVVSGNSVHYIRAGYLNWRLLLPPMITSVPMAYLGGRLSIEKEWFVLILFITLLVAGARLLISHRQYDDDSSSYVQMPVWLGCAVGAVLGFLAGVVGIGGGIFLAPILYNLRVGPPKHIATTASLFILVNSMAGLLGQWHKSGLAEIVLDYWYLPVLVLIGGQLGNVITIKLIPSRTVALLTALLVLFVASRLGWHMLYP
ncbi:MAG: putative membrane protein YfcA [Candidatus Endobugula sp.]|jgi:uncharacterized membrane protein YfcA